MESLNLDFFASTIQLFSPEKCQKMINRCEQNGFEKLKGFDPSYRNNTRYIFIDQHLADKIYRKLKDILPKTIKEYRDTWEICGMNERFRCCKYTENQKFKIHSDGCYERNSNEKSFLTLNIYLNDVDGKGHTRFFVSQMG